MDTRLLSWHRPMKPSAPPQQQQQYEMPLRAPLGNGVIAELRIIGGKLTLDGLIVLKQYLDVLDQALSEDIRLDDSLKQ